MGRKAGRELDALVAKEVMGLTVGTDPIWQKVYDQPDALVETSPDRTLRRTLQPYSTDIAAAWEVAEKIKEREITYAYVALEIHWVAVGGIYSVLYTIEDRPTRNCWRVAFHDTRDHCLVGDPVFHESLPMAICLAALKAKGVDL